MNLILDSSHFEEIFASDRPLIDLRAPCEFVLGSFPSALNLPLMDDQERAVVGTIYKQQGTEAAIRKGHELVSGELREARLHSWLQQIQSAPDTVLFCFRGGLRSQTVQKWLEERGCFAPLIKGGYKSLRSFLLTAIETQSERLPFFVITGMTGSGKTALLKKLPHSIDLEDLAQHQGSAFGAKNQGQPTQIDFENRLAIAMLKMSRQNPRMLFIEDESRMIGQRVVPETFFKRQRASPVIYLERSLEERVDHILDIYVRRRLEENAYNFDELLQQHRKSLNSISKKLGGLLTQECLHHLDEAMRESQLNASHEGHRLWIEKLLVNYYDPIYQKNLKIRAPKILFSGSEEDIVEKILTQTLDF